MPCGLNPSSPINLFKAASIASRSFFWLVPKLRRGRRPVVVGGKVRLAFITNMQAHLARSEKVRFASNSLQLSSIIRRAGCVQSGNQQRGGSATDRDSMPRRFGGLHSTLDRRSSRHVDKMATPIQKGIPFAANRLRAYSSAMPSGEEEMSLTKWRDLLGTELIIALEEIAKIEREGGNERHLYYVESCVEQFWTIISRMTNAADKVRLRPVGV
jgi:hypothetical protein